MSKALDSDLIAAIATPPGQGGIGIVRLSGPGARQVVESLLTRSLEPRQAVYGRFLDDDEVVDDGLAILFPEGQSFTGEEVVEMQVHGSPVVLQHLLDLCCSHGARIARPGEFSERAFLNDRLDLAQAEAIADLISSGSRTAARAARRSLQGEFSREVEAIAGRLEHLRVLVEACIDFPEEDIDPLHIEELETGLEWLDEAIGNLLTKAGQGMLINQGANIALIGAPNAGKSSLLNRLTGKETAIVTDIPGTTRDLLKADLVLDGVPIRVLDTAGLRVTDDTVEQIGVERATEAAQQADLVLIVLDGEMLEGPSAVAAEARRIGSLAEIDAPTIEILNKVDLYRGEEAAAVSTCALDGSGLDTLKALILKTLGRDEREVPFTARARHQEALSCAHEVLRDSQRTLAAGAGLELVADELSVAHRHLGEITGTVTPDDLLGRIFSEFCIGK